MIGEFIYKMAQENSPSKIRIFHNSSPKWVFHEMVVPPISTPKSSFFLENQWLLGTTILGNPQHVDSSPPPKKKSLHKGPYTWPANPGVQHLRIKSIGWGGVQGGQKNPTFDTNKWPYGCFQK